MKELTVSVEPDHIQGICDKASALDAIEELIWNALDADATVVSVRLAYTNMGALGRVTVSDNGTGFTPEQCEESFEKLGGSAKKLQTLTSNGRTIHGKEGKGRIKAFKIGKNAEWESRFKKDGKVREFTVSGDYKNLRSFSMTDDKLCSATIKDTGVTVTIGNIDSNFSNILNDSTVEKLTAKFAIYLLKYPGISIVYNSQPIAPEKIVDHRKTYPVCLTIAGKEIEAELDIIEWTCQTNRAVYLCDKNGFSFEETAPGIQAPGFNFTAHLKSDEIKELYNHGAFLSSGLDPANKIVLEPVKDVLRSHFRERDSAKSQDIIASWKAEKIYPYANTQSESPVERAERQVFDICALRFHEYIKDFDRTEKESKRIMFRLLQEALITNPRSVLKILSEVLNLKQEDQDDFARILERTKLSAVISATRLIVDRLDFLNSLDPLLYGKYQKSLKERTQLQNILTEELWIFGEQYALGCTEKNLRNILITHIKHFDRTKFIGDDIGEVTDAEGKERRFDIMLHRAYMGQPAHLHYLVIELKRPSLTIGKKELTQIDDYAYAIAGDDRFDKDKTTWDFILLGTKLDNYATEKSHQPNHHSGYVSSFLDGKIKVYAKTWASVIQDACWRYNFYKEKLQLDTFENVESEDQDLGLSYLQRKYSALLPPDVV